MSYTKEDITEYVRLWNLFEINKALDSGMPAEKLVILHNTDILLEAIIRKSTPIFNKIIKGAYDFSTNNFLYLHHAVRTKENHYIESILKKMTIEERNKKDSVGQNNALHIACQTNSQEIAHLLSAYNVNWDSLNELGQTPFHLLLRNCSYIEDNLRQDIFIKNINIKIKDIMGISSKDILKSFSLDKAWNSCPENIELLKFFKLFKE